MQTSLYKLLHYTNCISHRLRGYSADALFILVVKVLVNCHSHSFDLLPTSLLKVRPFVQEIGRQQQCTRGEWGSPVCSSVSDLLRGFRLLKLLSTMCVCLSNLLEVMVLIAPTGGPV